MEGLHVNPNVNPNTADSLPPAWLAVFHLLVWAGLGPYVVIAFKKEGLAWYYMVCAGVVSFGFGCFLLRWGLRRRVRVDRRVRPKVRDHLDSSVGTLVMLMAWFLDEESFPRWIGLCSSTVYGGYTTLYIASPELGIGFMELFMGLQHSYKHYQRVWVMLAIVATMCVTMWIRNHLRDRIEGSHGVGVYRCLTIKLRDFMGVERYNATARFFQGRKVVLWFRGEITLPIVERWMSPEERRVATLERQNLQLSDLLEDERRMHEEQRGQLDSEIRHTAAALQAERDANQQRETHIAGLERRIERLNGELRTVQREFRTALESYDERLVQQEILETRNNQLSVAIEEVRKKLRDEKLNTARLISGMEQAEASMKEQAEAFHSQLNDLSRNNSELQFDLRLQQLISLMEEEQAEALHRQLDHLVGTNIVLQFDLELQQLMSNEQH